MKPTASKLIRWAGLAALVAGVCVVVLGLLHPPNVLSSVPTTQWAVVHVLALAMSLFGLLGMMGLYARQVEAVGWLGLAGFLLFSLWLVLILPFTFFEVFFLPLLATEAPTFGEGFLGIFTGAASEINFGVLAAVYKLTGVLLILGGLVFGIATLRAGILSRWAAGLLAVAAALTPVAALLPLERQPLVVVPVGIALAWLGYALWSERREQAVDSDDGVLAGVEQPVVVPSNGKVPSKV
jgi:membrane protein implicated in regulation of membrane protease activity